MEREKQFYKYSLMQKKFNSWAATSKFPRVIALLFEAMHDTRAVQVQKAMKEQEDLERDLVASE